MALREVHVAVHVAVAISAIIRVAGGRRLRTFPRLENSLLNVSPLEV
jgi:hypothetical protein